MIAFSVCRLSAVALLSQEQPVLCLARCPRYGIITAGCAAGFLASFKFTDPEADVSRSNVVKVLETEVAETGRIVCMRAVVEVLTVCISI